MDLFPDALRHPFGFDEPLLGSEDYAGTVIWAPVSDTVTRLFRGPGAEVTDSETSTLRGGAEAQFSLAPAGVTYGTGNVTFYPKTNVLVAGADLPARLRADQWPVLTDAAAATREWQITQQPSDFEAAAGFCDRGGKIVAASDDQLATLQEAAADVTAWLRQDPSTRRLIDDIERITADVPPEAPITECPGSEDQLSSELDGVYRHRVTRTDLVRAGVTDPNKIKENTGRWTWRLDSGRYSYHTESVHFLANPDDSGRFTWDGASSSSIGTRRQGTPPR